MLVVDSTLALSLSCLIKEREPVPPASIYGEKKEGATE